MRVRDLSGRVKRARLLALVRSVSSLGVVDLVLTGAARRIRAIKLDDSNDVIGETERCASIVEAIVGSVLPMTELMDAMQSAMVDGVEAE